MAVVAKMTKLSGLRKTAILLIALRPQLSALLLRQFSQEEVEIISSEIANTVSVLPEEKRAVVEEFMELYEARQYILRGGISYAREILEQSLGVQRAEEILRKLTESSAIRPFSSIRKTDPRQLINFISGEHPQTIALILAYLDPASAAVILGALPQEQQSDIARRIALMERSSPEIIREVERVLENRLSAVAGQDFTSVGGVKTLVEILNLVDRGTEKTILETLTEEDPELAEDVRKRMFVFSDITTLDDVSIRRVLREVEMKDLACAMKGSGEEVRQRIFRNMSQRATEMLKEDIEMMGPVRLREVEEAQMRIVQMIRRLDETGEIVISRGGDDAFVF